MRLLHTLCPVFAVLLLPALSPAGIVLDLKPGSGTTEGAINSAVFSTTNLGGGTGSIKSFVRIQGENNDDVERGYNTPANVLDNKSSDQFNRDLLVGELAVVNVAGTDYYQFLLDVNESGNEPQISLDTVKIYTTSMGGQSIDPKAGSFVDEMKRYDMDQGMDNTVLLNSGSSGRVDMSLLIPVWANPNPADYLILYSEFGGFDGAHGFSAGFEEWAAVTVPEPGTASVIGVLTVLAGVRRRR